MLFQRDEATHAVLVFLTEQLLWSIGVLCVELIIFVELGITLFRIPPFSESNFALQVLATGSL